MARASSGCICRASPDGRRARRSPRRRSARRSGSPGRASTIRWRSSIASARSHYEIAAIETSPRAVDLFDWQPRFPVCVLFGSEIDGLSAELLDRCDTHVRIPMLGLKHSLNVSTAGGVVLYELLRKFRDRSCAIAVTKNPRNS